MFWILKSRNLAYRKRKQVKSSSACRINYVCLTGKPSFCIIRAYFLAARRESSSLLAPVHTILPDENINAVVLGSLILMITAAKRFGLYSALRACKAIFFKSNLQQRFTVETIFLQFGLFQRNELNFQRIINLWLRILTAIVGQCPDPRSPVSSASLV